MPVSEVHYSTEMGIFQQTRVYKIGSFQLCRSNSLLVSPGTRFPRSVYQLDGSWLKNKNSSSVQKRRFTFCVLFYSIHVRNAGNRYRVCTKTSIRIAFSSSDLGNTPIRVGFSLSWNVMWSDLEFRFVQNERRLSHVFRINLAKREPV